MEYQPGAVLCNLFLADELNRATSRTQSALLEAMEEGQVTVDGASHPVPRPFLVIATQNPAGGLGHPAPARLPEGSVHGAPVPGLSRPGGRDGHGAPPPGGQPPGQRGAGGGSDGLLALREKAGAVYLSDEVLDYIVRLVGATRDHPMILQGASPRATLALAAMAKAAALVRGRDYVNPEDVALVFPDVVPHRLLLSPRAEGDKSFDPAAELLARVSAPRIG